MRNVRIESDGTAVGTKVIDVESGEPIDAVVRVEWSIGTFDPTGTVVLELSNVPVTLEGLVERMVVPEDPS